MSFKIGLELLLFLFTPDLLKVLLDLQGERAAPWCDGSFQIEWKDAKLSNVRLSFRVALYSGAYVVWVASRWTSNSKIASTF